jgi:predicted DNA-binding transcriptional regulator YafY
MRDAKLLSERFELRKGFEPSRLRDARTARVLYTEEVARWALERGARPLKDGSAVSDLPVGSPEWLESEIFSFRGSAVVLEPGDLRAHIRDRAKELATELGVNRLRVTTS